ncbi:phospholipid:diacylglycerol acyltransferase [Coprinopsis marcescibilis]|uniref:Phospholipid:diacylglycerol acyltransferase n=1 Tax=Coprinopsis marcescibilis TaxID=230819 RepID=A0A5C3KSW2_COPMA|nr:phospholipid:diacylglycerol acyltransferase [Coprinopsis marcescibilis]
MTLARRRKSRPGNEDLSEVTADADASPDVQDVLHEKDQLEEEVRKLSNVRKPWYRSGRFMFPLGMTLGILLGFSFIEPQDIQDIHGHMEMLMTEYDINLPQLPDFDFSRVEMEWTKFRSNIPELWKFNNDGREFQIGEALKERGLDAEYPVVLVPGIISTGLESWSTSPEYRAFFRQKLWGGFNMLSQVTFNKEKWIAAMMLDPITGLDPPGVKIRAAEGIDAASSFIQGYWIWSKIVENLAVVNYDTNNLYLAPYDWRLSFYNLEERDGYFSKMKRTVEGLRERHNKKVVIAAHSMGSTVMLVRIFFKWVESPLHGKGGNRWVEDNIEAYITIAGTHLGVTKAMAAFLSGEMKDTVQMNPAGAYVLERFFSRKERKGLFLSWAGSASMWMKGGNAIWGDGSHAPDDDCNATHSHGDLIAFRNEAVESKSIVGSTKNMTAEEAGAWILQRTPSSFQRMMESNYSYGIERDEDQLAKNDLDHRKWTNPLEVRLPYAPSMKIFCAYGTGKDTEARDEDDDADAQVETSTCPENMQGCENANGIAFKLRKSHIDFAYTNESALPKIQNGVKVGEGDGTVSLLSLGAMCVEGWKRKRWNPAGIKVTTVEFLHRPIASIPRGGANTSDHVDILGASGLNELLLKVATGAGDEVQETIVSNIREYAAKMKWD